VLGYKKMDLTEQKTIHCVTMSLGIATRARFTFKGKRFISMQSVILFRKCWLNK
jgi:hypothetical protein